MNLQATQKGKDKDRETIVLCKRLGRGLKSRVGHAAVGADARRLVNDFDRKHFKERRLGPSVVVEELERSRAREPVARCIKEPKGRVDAARSFAAVPNRTVVAFGHTLAHVLAVLAARKDDRRSDLRKYDETSAVLTPAYPTGMLGEQILLRLPMYTRPQSLKRFGLTAAYHLV